MAYKKFELIKKQCRYQEESIGLRFFIETKYIFEGKKVDNGD